MRRDVEISKNQARFFAGGMILIRRIATASLGTQKAMIPNGREIEFNLTACIR